MDAREVEVQPVTDGVSTQSPFHPTAILLSSHPAAMMKRLAYLRLLSLGLVVLASCSASAQLGANQSLGFALRDRLRGLPGLAWLSPIVPIAETGQNRNGIAYLEGRVEQHLPLVGQGLYQLMDQSGSIWVVTASPPPAIGENVTIRATIHYEPILMRGQDVGEHYAEELERLVKAPD